MTQTLFESQFFYPNFFLSNFVLKMLLFWSYFFGTCYFFENLNFFGTQNFFETPIFFKSIHYGLVNCWSPIFYNICFYPKFFWDLNFDKNPILLPQLFFKKIFFLEIYFLGPNYFGIKHFLEQIWGSKQVRILKSFGS